jgi:hypothetical protein
VSLQSLPLQFQYSSSQQLELLCSTPLAAGPHRILVRAFSGDSLKDVLNKINKDHEKNASSANEGEAKATDDAAGSSEKANGDADSGSSSSSHTSEQEGSASSSANAGNFVDNVRDKVGSVSSWLRTNFDVAWEEMTGKATPSSLERKVHQADSYRPASARKVDGDESIDEEEEPKYEGPTALVVVKDPVSAWERMKDRLKDSPLIKEILKNSKKIGEAAAHTDIGKQATKIGQGILLNGSMHCLLMLSVLVSTGVRDKWEDAREVWETSQNPLIYTLSGVWENLTGTTEEGHCIAQLRKLDPNFEKVCLWQQQM